MNPINYDKFKSPNSLVSQLELIGYISDKLNNRNISCIITDEFAAEFYTGSFYRAKYISIIIDSYEETAAPILSDAGFIKEHGFYVLNSSKIGLAVYIKVKLTPFQSDDSRLTSIKCRSGFVIKIIGLEDLLIEYIYDYSRSYSFRKSEQILAMIFIHYESINMDFIYKKCIELDVEQLINEFIDQSKEIKKVAENENN